MISIDIVGLLDILMIINITTLIASIICSILIVLIARKRLKDEPNNQVPKDSPLGG